MAFKVPILPKLRPPKPRPSDQPFKILTSELPASSLDEISVLSCLGRGAFGEVSLCKRGTEFLVLKELLGDDVNTQRLFAKEAKLVHSIRHDNVVKFDSVCYGNGNNSNVCAFLMEFSQFNFSPFGHEHSVSSLGDFLTYIDKFNCEGFEHLSLEIVTDVCKGLQHLHEHNIAHRDLKPGNILVSNQHYAALNPDERSKYWASKPIIAKLTDFGESRAALVQTNSIAHTETSNVRRGSPAYMAPEIYAYDGRTKMDIADLMTTDMWSYAMVIFMVLNPNFKWPYQKELEGAKKKGNPKPYKDILSDFFHREVIPSHGDKYQALREKEWLKVTEAYTLCAKFKHRPSIDEVLRFLTSPVNACLDGSLRVNDEQEIEVDHIFNSEDDDAIICEIASNLGDEWCDLGLASSNKDSEVKRTEDVSQFETSQSGHKRKFDAVDINSHADDGIDRDTARKKETTYFHREVSEQCHPVKVVRGHFHQASSHIFTHEAAGTQCSSISLMAVVWASLKSHTDWSSTDIDDILMRGDIEHVNVLKDLGWPMTRSEAKLDMDELPSVVTVQLNEHRQKASVGVLNDSYYCLSKDFEEVMTSALQEKPDQHFIIRMFDKCAAILRCHTTGSYSILDPHSLDADGAQVPDGSACLMHFQSPSAMILYLTNVMNGTLTAQIDIAPVDVEFLSKSSDHVSSSGYEDVVVAQISDESDSEETAQNFEPSAAVPSKPSMGCKDKEYAHDDQQLPVYLRGKGERFRPLEAAEVLYRCDQDSNKCTKVPLRVRENCAFLVDLSALSSASDIKADMNGAYTKVLRIGTWTITINDRGGVRVLYKKKVDIPRSVKNQYHLSINCKMNYAGLGRSIFVLYDGVGNIVNNAALLQYHVSQSNGNGKLEFEVLPHGNRRHGTLPFFPTQPSTLANIKSAVRDGDSSSVIYNKMSNSDSGIMGVRNPGQIPRSRHQVYQCKANSNNKYDEIEELLLHVQTKEETIVLDHQDIPEDLWVLGTKQMCSDLSRLCGTLERPNCYPISIDPTFEFGHFEVTPVTYRHPFMLSKRSGVHPVLLGPTAVHHSKDAVTFGRVISSLTRSCPNLKSTLVGFVTDGETALHNAMRDGFPNATGLRCFRHFENNCKKKLNDIGIRSSNDQKFLMEFVFGKSGEGGFVDSKDKTELAAAIQNTKEQFDGYEGNLLGADQNYQSKFWKYIKRKEGMIANHMIQSQRIKAGMPCDQRGKPYRCYTNQSESVNNILTRQKEAISKTPKRRSPTSKLTFVKNVWEEVVRHQSGEIGRALCGMSEEFRLTNEASYLEVKQEDWFSWSQSQREHYCRGFNSLTVKDILERKPIKAQKPANHQLSHNIKTLGPEFKLKLQNLMDLSSDIAETIMFETNNLLKSPSAVKEMPSLEHENARKYLVASKACKRGFYVCILYSDHVCCDCQAYKYQMLCKHSLCLAIQNDIIDLHLTYISKRNTKKQKGKLLKPSKEAAGKKGGRHKNQWRQRNSDATDEVIPGRPFSEIHHNNIPFYIIFLLDEPKAKECYECGVEFPRIQIIRPFDIVISHKEKWCYTTKDEPHKRRVSAKFTTRFYCVQASCILRRFHYFSASLVKIDDRQRERLTHSHKELLKRELNVDFP